MIAAAAMAAGAWATPTAAAGQVSAASAQARTLPRTPDGKPDLSGFWQVMNTAAWDIQDHSAQKGIPAGQGVVEGNDIPYPPAAAAKKQQNFANRATADPRSKCYLPGVPRITYLPFPFQILQTPQLSRSFTNTSTRFVKSTSTEPASPGRIDWWMGDSRGRWEGDTLVVDVVHFNDETWFDRAGNFHSDALHVIERYTLADPDHIDYEVTIEDPKVFTRPWKMRMPLYRHTEPNFQLLEYECHTFDDEPLR